MKYNLLGNSGLRVSQLCMGTMTFGSGWRSVGATSQEDANEIVKFALESGINFFDTADVYSRGDSEKTLGKALKAAGVARERVIVATKVRGAMSDDMNDTGLTRHHIMNAIEGSLARLGMDYVDLYQIHGFDALTPMEETMRALNDVVTSGKARYIGCSNLAAWQLAKANSIARKHGWSRFITYQGYYSLAGRGIENEVIPLCRDQNMGILTWSPLAGGLLTGKYRKGSGTLKDVRLKGELKGFIPTDEARLNAVLDALEKVSAAHKAPQSAVALAWLKCRAGVSSIIIGARNMAQLRENVQAADLELSPEEIEKLTAAGAEDLPYPQWMILRQGGGREKK